MKAQPLILVDGLWLLRRPALRRLFSLKVFLECGSRTRLSRRLERDVTQRGRTSWSIREQFSSTVQPMHEKFVAPQKKWADRHLRHPFSRKKLDALFAEIKQLGGLP